MNMNVRTHKIIKGFSLIEVMIALGFRLIKSALI